MSSRRETFEVSRPQTIDVRLPAGQLEVRADGEGLVTVQVDGRYADDFTVSQSGSTVTIHYDGRRGIGGAAHEVIVSAPSRSRLMARVASADVTTDGVLADVTLATASGDAYFGGEVGTIDAKTASGRMTIERCDGSARLRTASGRIQVMEANREVSIVTASGDVQVRAATGDVGVKTASGRVRIDEFDGEQCVLKTVSGGVRVGVPSGRTVHVDLQSLSGRIDLPAEPGSNGSSGDRELRVKAKTVSGNISIQTLQDGLQAAAG